MGSPPQVRGKPIRAEGSTWKVRITPAGAGKTSDSNAVYGASKDHPRRCGENSAWHCQQHVRKGSPPQVRGKHKMKAIWIKGERITPAGAGKTTLMETSRWICWDHPRRCGENMCITRTAPGFLGSPPQVRGKPLRLSPCSP